MSMSVDRLNGLLLANDSQDAYLRVRTPVVTPKVPIENQVELDETNAARSSIVYHISAGFLVGVWFSAWVAYIYA
jgi:hypothetical protein